MTTSPVFFKKIRRGNANLLNFDEISDDLMILSMIFRIATTKISKFVRFYKDPMMNISKKNIGPKDFSFDFKMNCNFIKSEYI